MDDFPESWLALREPYDRAARSVMLARAFLKALPPRPRLLDLAAGTGANARYLESLALCRPRWLLADASRALLASAHGLRGAVECECLDLARESRRLDLAGVDGVTASAFCDLVSAVWIGDLAGRAARHGVPLLFALTVDGRIRWRPSDPADAAVMAAFRRDQHRDKGFGRALGPQAPGHMVAALRRFGYAVRLARSDWRIAATDDAVLDHMVSGVVEAADRAGASAAVDTRGWAARRRAQIAAGSLSLTVGHVDCLARMRAGRSPFGAESGDHRGSI